MILRLLLWLVLVPPYLFVLVWYVNTAKRAGRDPKGCALWGLMGTAAYWVPALGFELFLLVLAGATSPDVVARLMAAAPATITANRILAGIVVALIVRQGMLRMLGLVAVEAHLAGRRQAVQTGSLRLLRSVIRRKLWALRSALRRRLTSEGVSWLVVAVVATVFVTLGFDYYFRLNRDLRWVLMEASLIGVAWVVWRQLIRPLVVPMGQADLALLVERRYGQLGDRLVSAVEFSQADDADLSLASGAMIDRMAEQANEMARPLNFGEVVERGYMWRAVGAAAAAAMLLGGFAVWKSDVMALWFQRNVTIWSRAEWPQQTVLKVEGGPDFTVVRGRDLGVTISVAGGKFAPEHVTVHARYPSVAGMTEDRVHRPDADARTYVKIFRAVSEPFEFYVTGGDDSHDADRPHKVHVLDPPAVRDVSFTVVCPPYMKQAKPRKYPGALGTINVPAGSTIQITARSTKNLTSASIFLDDKPAGEITVSETAVSDLPGPQPRALTGHVALQVQPVVRGKARRVQARELRLSRTDTDKITNPSAGQYLLQVLPDQDPKVSLRKRGVGASVTPEATLPLLVHATDDNGLSALKAQVRVLPKKDKPIDEPIKLVEPGAREARPEHELELAKRFKPGTAIQISVEVKDTFPPEWGGPQHGTSGVLDFRVVERDKLMAELVRRQKELRLEFIQTIALQTSARAKVLLATQTAAGQGVPLEARQAVSAAAGLQASVASECAKAAMTLQAILDELTNNKLGTTESRAQLAEGVIRPLRDLSGPIQSALEALRGMAKLTDAGGLRSQGDLLAQAQQKILDRLKAIRDRMQKLESQQELAYKLEMIIKLWDKVVKTTRGESEAEVDKALGPGKKPTTRPTTRPTTTPAGKND